MPGVLVRVLRKEGAEWVGRSKVTTGEKGAFRVEGLDGGLYRLIPGAETLPIDERSAAEVLIPQEKNADLVLELEQVDDAIAVHVRGTVTFDSGRVPARFSFAFWRFDGTRHVRCLVEGSAGKFTKRLPYAGEFAVTSMKVDGESHDGFFETFDVVEGANLAVVVEEAREAGVLVVDAASGQPVNGASVHREVDEDHERMVASPAAHNPPGPNTQKAVPLKTDATGRVSLGHGRGEQEVWVIADGFAWSRARVRFARGEDARVALVPGGVVQIRVEDWSRLDDPRMHAWEIAAGQTKEDVSGIPMQLPPADGEGELVVDGMPVGRYDVRVLRGAWFKGGEVYGKVVVDVRRGERTTAEIKTTPPPKSFPVDIVVAVEGDWPSPPSSLLLDGLDPGNASVYSFTEIVPPPDGKTIRLRTEPVPPGRYRVEISPQGWTSEVTVPQGGGGLRFEIPAPGMLRLLVKNSTTGEPERSSVVHWTANPKRSAPNVQVLPNEGPGRFRFPVPPGSIRLLVSGAGLRSRSAEVQATTGSVVERTVVLDASAALTVRLSVDGKPYTGKASAILMVKEPPADVADIGKHFVDTTMIVHASNGEASFTDFDPGVWVLEINAPGMKEVPPRELRLAAGTPVRVDIALESLK